MAHWLGTHGADVALNFMAGQGESIDPEVGPDSIRLSSDWHRPKTGGLWWQGKPKAQEWKVEAKQGKPEVQESSEELDKDRKGAMKRNFFYLTF